MKTLNQYILEELDNNLFWLLDKWFERNTNQLEDFKILVNKYHDENFTIDDLEDELNKTKYLKSQLEKFINFIDNDIRPVKEKNYIQILKDIILQVLNNKSNRKIMPYKVQLNLYMALI